MRAPQFNSSIYKGLMTTVQGFVAAIVLIVSGVFAAVQGTPGCFDAVVSSLTTSGVQIAGWFGLGAGITSFILNEFINRVVKKEGQTY